MSTEEGQQPEDFKADLAGWAERWKAEIDAAKKAQEHWREKQAPKVVSVYLDERTDGKEERQTHWNLFHGDVTTLLAMLYGNTPKANVNRRFADSSDDVARVAGEIGERLLHSDIEKRSDPASEAFGDALSDWLLPGLGVVRVRYEMEEEVVPGKPAIQAAGKELSEAVPETTKRSNEQALIDYVHWKDFLWSPCRVWSEVTWLGFAADLPKAAFVKRFGADAWKLAPKQSQAKDEEKERDPWARVRVWELWHKGEGKVFWYVEGAQRVLEVKDDPLGLDGFWPCPKPLWANTTTTKLVPKPDYVLAQDLYLEINRVSTRIDKLQRAIKAVGVYDEASPEVARVLDEACENEMLAAKNFALFIERGGIQGAMQFLPLEPIVVALTALRDYRRELVDALYQVTGRSDIMRGQATSGGATATEQAAKVRFGSVRVQRRQDEFARFVSEAQSLKLEIICKHFLPETILERSNAALAFGESDKEHVPGAIALLKSETLAFRVEVKSESVSLTDFANLKQERTEVIGAISQFLTAAAPMAEAVPGSMKYLLQLLQHTVAGLRGSSGMEGVLDHAIQDAEAKAEQAAANPQQPPPDPKVQAQQLKMQGDQMKAQTDMQREQFKLQGDLTKIQAETQAHAQQEQVQAEWNTREAAQKALITHELKAQEPKPAPPKGGGNGR